MSFSEFVRDRQYLQNVTPSTITWYKYALAWLPNESPTAHELKAMVMRMREKGLKATACNSVIRGVNAYLRWSGSGERVPKLKEEQFLIEVFDGPQIASLVKWKPKKTNFYQRRLHTLILALLDTGCRISELLTASVPGCDFDNLLLTVTGKGRKQRKVPFSIELRRVLVRYLADFKITGLLFPTIDGRKQSRDNVRRDVKALCRKLKFNPPRRTLHAFRHTFGTNYIRRGGSEFYLQKVFGHADASTTRKYAHLATADLCRVHEGISLLNPSS